MPGEHDLALPPWAAPLVPTFERVAHHLELAEGFMLLPVELPDLITADLLARWLTRRGLPCSLVDPDLQGASPPLLEQFTGAPNDVVATLLFVDKLSDRLPGALQLLNQQRHVLALRHPRPLLWSGPARFLDLTWRSAPDLWSIAAVPIRLAAPVTRSSRPAARSNHPDRRIALHDLLVSMYAPDELRRLVAMHFADIRDELPGPPASLPALAFALADLLERLGLINRAFFDILRSERSRRFAEINAVERLWSDSVRPARRLVDEAHIQATLHHALQRPNQVLFIVGADVQRLHERVQEAVLELRATHSIRVVPLEAMDDEEFHWSDTPASNPFPLSAAVDGPRELILVVDAAGRPLLAPDSKQMGAIRDLFRTAAKEAAKDREIQLVVPLASTREAAEALARNLPVFRGERSLPVHILDLDALAPP